MKEAIFNLQHDWDGHLAWFEVPEKYRRQIKQMVVAEVDAYRKQVWWRRLLNLTPRWNPFRD
jgi:hypothetical protein